MTAVPSFALDSASLVATKAYRQMDPRLQRVVARRQRGILEFSTASTEADEVAVIAKVSDIHAWENLSEVRIGTTLGAETDGTQIVTARIPVQRIEHLRQQDFVVSLKAAQRLQPTLDATTLETQARSELLPAGNLSQGGTNIVVGIVDYGCDFGHHNFRSAGGATRLRAIWDQNGPTRADSPFGYGRVYNRDLINAALQQPNPYLALGYAPAVDNIFQRGTHGTHVMDIAAGNGHGSNTPGLAPQADLVFVDVSHADLSATGSAVVGQSFGDSTRLLEALKFIFDQAGERPCVINVSLGTNGGPHDGTTLVEEGIDRLLQQAPNRAVVIAAGNAFDDGIHAAGTLAAGGTADINWEIPANDFSHNELEIWYGAEDRFAVELIAPGGQSVGIVEPGQNGELVIDGQVIIFIGNRLTDPNNNDNMIGVFLEQGLPSGQWIVRLHGRTVVHGAFHAWIERDNSNPSMFSPPHDNSHTIGSISCGQQTIVVGSYDAHKVSTPLSFFSGAGPTRDGREKPEISAPGHAVLAAHSRTETGVVRKSGTSMAAPAVAGIVALVLAQAQAQGLSLSSAQIRDIIFGTTRRTPPAGTNWHAQYGQGRIDASAALAQVIALGQQPASASAKRKRPSRSSKARKAATSKRSTRSQSKSRSTKR